MIDPETKKCTGCGKQYFHLPKLTTRMIVGTILIIVLAGANIYQYVQLASIKKEYNFYHDYAVIVPTEDDSYHRYGCPNIDENDSFWIYNINAAESRGYTPCPECID